MRNVSIIGVGLTPVAEYADEDLRHLAGYAVRAALEDAQVGRVDGVFVANQLAGVLARQEHLGALVADFAGLRGAEAMRIEAAAASGAAALRAGFLAVASGALDAVLVAGVEQTTGAPARAVTAALAYALDDDYEVAQGATPAALAALLMRRYMHDYGATLEDFAALCANAHANARTSAHALQRDPVTPEEYLRAPMVCDPVNAHDQAPLGDGAAAVVLMPAESVPDAGPHAVHIAASAVATDAVALHDRRDPLFFEAVYAAAVKAYEMAGTGPGEIDVLELHDGFGILAVLSLEACGFAKRGEGARLARDEALALTGRIPLSTFGGLQARGEVGGATGVYQVVELVQQLRGTAGANQVPNARLGMSVALGGIGATAVVHVLRAGET